MKSEILNRKGARKTTEIPVEVLELLNTGSIETVNLMEWLAVDHIKLIQTNFEKIGISKKAISLIEQAIANQKKPSTMNTVKLVGGLVYENIKERKNKQTIFKKISTHKSDSIRCYAPYLISLDNHLTIEEKLNNARGLVSDHHFGIREVVWMALRPSIDKNLKASLEILNHWTEDKDENIRRFTTESTRPRGVWCKHIEALKETPQLALPILDRLKSDDSTYVQNSVGNWLNDASKTQPIFVKSLCEKWKKESPTKETEKIIKRAMRTLLKK